MPRIKEYESQVNPQGGQASPGRRADASDFGGGTGMARLGAAVTGVGSDLALIAHRKQEAESAREVTDVYVQFAKKESEWSQRMREEGMTADPSNLAWADEFNDRVAKDIETLDGKYSTAAGRDAYLKHRASMGSHFVERAGTYQAQMTGAYARQSAEAFLDQRRNAVNADPNQFQRTSQDMTDFFNDPSGFNKYIPQADRQKMLRTSVNELALSAVKGLIKNGMPESAKAELNGGKWDAYLDADKKTALLQEAEVTINGRWAENEHQHKIRERERKAEHEMTGNKFIAKFVDGNLTPKEILDSDLPPTGDLSKQHYLDMLTKRDKEPAFKTDPSTYQELYAGIHAEEGDPRRLKSEQAIDDAFLSGKLTPEHVDRLRKEFRELRTDEGASFATEKKRFFDANEPRINKSNPLMGINDMDGKHENLRYQQFVNKKIDEYRKQGKDPYPLIDSTEGNPEYLGRPEIVSQFQKTIQDSMKTASDNLMRGTPKPPPPPEKARKEGESMMDWLGRQFKGAFERAGNAESAVPPVEPPAAPALPKAEDTPPSDSPDRVMDILKNDEGFRGQVYKDTKGKNTIAYGRNLDAKPLKKEEGEFLLKGDVADARKEASRTFSYYDNLDGARKDAVTMLVFNMGPNGLKTFKRFNEAMKDKNYVTAASELLDSDWAEAVGPTRSNKIANMIRTGKTE